MTQPCRHTRHGAWNFFGGDDRILGMKNLITAIDADRLIYTIRGRRVMLDADLAMIYGVPTKRLNEQVRRNQERFPEDFAFPLAPHEAAALNRSQFATGSQKHRDPRSLPVAFTEHGAIMLASVLKSPVAVAARFAGMPHARIRVSMSTRRVSRHCSP